MSTNLSLLNLVDQLQKDNARKRDIIVPSQCLQMTDRGDLCIKNIGSLPESLRNVLHKANVAPGLAKPASFTVAPTVFCHGQISEKLGIDKRYYDRMRETALPLLSSNVNYWLGKSEENRFLRTFVSNNANGVGIARALLSDSFKTIDNYDVLVAALEAIKHSRAKVEIQSSSLTETRMYVRVIAPDIEVQAKTLLDKYRVPGSHKFPKGGQYSVTSGFVFGNSEVGKGAFFVAPRIWIQVCENGLIMYDEAMKKVHLGSQMQTGIIEWSEATRRKEMELIMSQMKDAVATFLSPRYLQGTVDRIEELGKTELNHPVDAVQNVCKFYGVSDEHAKSVVNYFIQGADTTAFGVSQALTYFAHEQEDADLQFDMEMAGMEVLNKIGQFDVPVRKREVKQKSDLKSFSQN